MFSETKSVLLRISYSNTTCFAPQVFAANAEANYKPAGIAIEQMTESNLEPVPNLTSGAPNAKSLGSNPPSRQAPPAPVGRMKGNKRPATGNIQSLGGIFGSDGTGFSDRSEVKRVRHSGPRGNGLVGNDPYPPPGPPLVQAKPFPAPLFLAIPSSVEPEPPEVEPASSYITTMASPDPSPVLQFAGTPRPTISPSPGGIPGNMASAPSSFQFATRVIGPAPNIIPVYNFQHHRIPQTLIRFTQCTRAQHQLGRRHLVPPI